MRFFLWFQCLSFLPESISGFCVDMGNVIFDTTGHIIDVIPVYTFPTILIHGTTIFYSDIRGIVIVPKSGEVSNE